MAWERGCTITINAEMDLLIKIQHFIFNTMAVIVDNKMHAS